MQPDTRPTFEKAPPPDVTPGIAASGDGIIDLRELLARIIHGLPGIVGLALLGLTAAVLIALAASFVKKAPVNTRVTFAFPGIERGEYPDGSRFQPDDLRAPAIVGEAMRRVGLDVSSDAQSKIRNAISIDGIIPPSVTKLQNKQRAAGKQPDEYIPDEYTLTLSLPAYAAISQSQREQLLLELVNVASEHFRRNYGDAPVAFGAAFETLKNADYPEYELVFNTELETLSQSLTDYLTKKAKGTEPSAEAASQFRSPTTNLSFSDLLADTKLFSQIHLNTVLGRVHEKGLSKNKKGTLLKMAYAIKQLEYRERQAADNEQVVLSLLKQTQMQGQTPTPQNSAASERTTAPLLLDKGMIASIVANDSHNLLVNRALSTGLTTRRAQAEKARMIALRANLEKFSGTSEAAQSQAMDALNASISKMEMAYRELAANVRETQADFTRQEYGHAIRLTAQIEAPSRVETLGLAAVAGAVVGAALAIGLLLLDLGTSQKAAPAQS